MLNKDTRAACLKYLKRNKRKNRVDIFQNLERNLATCKNRAAPKMHRFRLHQKSKLMNNKMIRDTRGFGRDLMNKLNRKLQTKQKRKKL